MPDSSMTQAQNARIAMLKKELPPRYQRVIEAMDALDGSLFSESRYDLAVTDLDNLLSLIRCSSSIEEDAQRYRFLRNASDLTVIDDQGVYVADTELDDALDEAISDHENTLWSES